MARDLVLMRFTDANNQRLAALCRPAEGVETLKEIIGSDDPQDADWFSQEHQAAVVLDTTGTVTITSHEDLANLCLWFSMASLWLKSHGG